MTLLILEALAAMAVLVFIVWWTMFSGRRRGERATGQEALVNSPRRRGRGGNSGGDATGGSNGSSDGDGGDGGGGDGGGD